MRLSQAYIYGGQIFGPGEVDDDLLPEEAVESLRQREENVASKNEVRSIVDATQSSRLRPSQIMRPEVGEETVTPAKPSELGLPAERRATSRATVRTAPAPTPAAPADGGNAES